MILFQAAGIKTLQTGVFKSELQRVDPDSLEVPWEQELQQGLETEEMVKPRAQSWGVQWTELRTRVVWKPWARI